MSQKTLYTEPPYRKPRRENPQYPDPRPEHANKENHDTHKPTPTLPRPTRTHNTHDTHAASPNKRTYIQTVDTEVGLCGGDPGVLVVCFEAELGAAGGHFVSCKFGGGASAGEACSGAVFECGLP